MPRKFCFHWHLVKKAGAGRWRFSAGGFHQFLIPLLVEALPLVIGFAPFSLSCNLIFFSLPSCSASLCPPVSPYSISVIRFPFWVQLLQTFTLTPLHGAWLMFSWILFPSLSRQWAASPPLTGAGVHPGATEGQSCPACRSDAGSACRLVPRQPVSWAEPAPW